MVFSNPWQKLVIIMLLTFAGHLVERFSQWNRELGAYVEAHAGEA